MRLTDRLPNQQDTRSLSYQSKQILEKTPSELLNPSHENFNFHLWANLVREKMRTVLQKET